MAVRLADRLSEIPPYPFAAIGKRVAELNAAGNNVIRLDMGSPDLPAPPQAVEALYKSAQKPNVHGYGGFNGIPALLKAFADYYARRFEVDLDPKTQILTLIGSKEGLVNFGLAVLNPGDVVLVPDPGYPAYAVGAQMIGAVPYEVPLVPERGFLPDLKSVPADVLKKARLLWVNYPNNPTGAVASLEDYAEIVAFCKEHNLILASDNPYSDLAFDGHKPHSVLEVPGAVDIAVEFNSLSKIYNMAGWRVGVCVGNPELVNALMTIKSNIDSGLFTSIQEASIVALNEVSQDWVAERNAVYQRRRDIIVDALPSIGLEGESPKAGMYVWAKVTDPSGDDMAYTQRAREEAFVSMAPGRMYGSSGAGYVRMSLVTDEDKVRMAMDRLAKWYSSTR